MELDYRQELAAWTVVSVLLFVVSSWLAWQAGQQPQSWLRRLYESLAGSPFGRAFLFLVRLIYYIGIPYSALLSRALSLVVIGMLGTQTSELPWWTLGWRLVEWAGALGWTAGLGVLAAVALALGWWNAQRALGEGLPVGGLLPRPSILITVRECLYAQVHWAFYRAAPLVLIADPYWATLAGAALVLFEWALDSAWRADLLNGVRREALLMQLTWLALSACIFALTRNVWPILLLHIALAWATGRWLELLKARSPAR